MICGVPLLDRKIAPKKNCNPKESPKGVNFIKSHENHPAVLEKGDESSWRGEIDEIIVFSVNDYSLSCFTQHLQRRTKCKLLCDIARNGLRI